MFFFIHFDNLKKKVICEMKHCPVMCAFLELTDIIVVVVVVVVN